MKKHYVVYMDDGHAFKLDIPARTEKEAREFVSGNGEIIAVRQGIRTASDPISIDCIVNALQKAFFGQMEIDLITRALRDCEFIA